MKPPVHIHFVKRVVAVLSSASPINSRRGAIIFNDKIWEVLHCALPMGWCASTVHRNSLERLVDGAEQAASDD